MIRRGFWLAVGATGGVIGYRRAAALGRGLAGTLMLSQGTEPERKSIAAAASRPAGRERKAGRGLARQAIRLTRDVRRFNRDVREGMDLYLARHPGRQSPTLVEDRQRNTRADHDERVKDDR